MSDTTDEYDEEGELRDLRFDLAAVASKLKIEREEQDRLRQSLADARALIAEASRSMDDPCGCVCTDGPCQGCKDKKARLDTFLQEPRK